MDSVDWNRLNDLRDDIGDEDFADVALLFVAELQDTLDRLTDDTAQASDFHFLRGSASNLGFIALVAACSAAEAACNAGDLPDVDSLRKAFADAMAEVGPCVPELAGVA